MYVNRWINITCCISVWKMATGILFNHRFLLNVRIKALFATWLSLHPSISNSSNSYLYTCGLSWLKLSILRGEHYFGIILLTHFKTNCSDPLVTCDLYDTSTDKPTVFLPFLSPIEFFPFLNASYVWQFEKYFFSPVEHRTMEFTNSPIITSVGLKFKCHRHSCFFSAEMSRRKIKVCGLSNCNNYCQCGM